MINLSYIANSSDLSYVPCSTCDRLIPSKSIESEFSEEAESVKGHDNSLTPP